MKKFLKKATVLMTAFIMLFAVAACGDDSENIDPNKTQIYVGLFDGGLGREWMDDAKTRFEAAYPQYQIMIQTGKQKYDSELVFSNFSSYNDDIFFMDYCNPEGFQRYINAGYAADIADVIEEDLTEFGEDGSIIEKLSSFLRDSVLYNDKAYSLPWYQASYQMAYDVELFETERFYKDAGGAWVGLTPAGEWTGAKHAGQDDVEGTYDDGLPRTYSEFFALLDRMNSKGVIPLTWTGGNANYFNSLLANIFANYEGYEGFSLNFTLSGEDKTLGEINLDNAWRLKNGQKGKEYAMQFARDIMRRGKESTNADYFSSSVFMTSQDNIAAQNEFLTSFLSSKKIAMIIEGSWWETEAAGSMATTAQRSGSGYAYGTRRFGVMPLPKADDGSSSDRTTICSSSATSRIFVNNNSARKDAAKLFLQFVHTEKSLSAMTGFTNVARPYSYELAPADAAKMTPYGKELFGLHSAADLVYDEVPLHDFLRYDGSKFINYMGLISSSVTLNPASYFLQNTGTVSDLIGAMGNTQSAWAEAVSAFKAR